MIGAFIKPKIIAEDPKKMFTDSSFYNSKYHPTIADQVEMAHKLSSAMFNEQNKGTKGAKMYLTRMENSGEPADTFGDVCFQFWIIFRQIGLNGWFIWQCLGKWIHRSENFDDGQ